MQPADNPPYLAIQIIQEVTDELYAACQRLMPQLTENKPAPARQELEELVTSDCSRLFVARDITGDHAITGMLTLALFRVPSGMRGWIEDLVVDESSRGKGVGQALVCAALEYAREAGAGQVGLTCNPARQAAHRLYMRLGFETRNAQAYRYDLKKKE
jgi:GNAT superfamily N-acetyltransferase